MSRQPTHYQTVIHFQSIIRKYVFIYFVVKKKERRGSTHFNLTNNTLSILFLPVWYESDLQKQIVNRSALCIRLAKNWQNYTVRMFWETDDGPQFVKTKKQSTLWYFNIARMNNYCCQVWEILKFISRPILSVIQFRGWFMEILM